MKLTDFTRASASYYNQLRQQIDNLPRRKAQIYDNCTLPSGCTPAQATLYLYKDAFQYVMHLEEDINYSGSNQALARLCKDSGLSFNNFDEMRQFMQTLPPEPSPTRRPNSPESVQSADSYELNTIVNMEELTILAGSSQASPDCLSIRRELEKIIMGQEWATETVAHQCALHLSKSNSKKPLSFMFYGEPGTGKSEMAKALSKILSKLGPHQYADVWTDLNQFSEAHSVYRLLGSPPGYVGYDDTPVFEMVTRNPYTVFIFDELDKAHPEVLKTFMAILDEGRCAARKEQKNHSREHDFKNCIFIFASNYRLGAPSPKQKIGFSLSHDVEDIRHEDDAVDINYREAVSEDEPAALTKRIYRNTEAARKAFLEAGVLREIASRFNCFVEFKELSAEAKIRILAKQVVETGFEYNIRLTHIAPAIMQALINASASEDALTVRSFKSVIEGYLATAFAKAGAQYSGQRIRLEGTIEALKTTPA